MADFVFNIALGKVGAYEELVGVGNAAFVIVLLQSAGIEADSALRDHDNLSVLLAATNDECAATNYVRKLVTAATPTINDTTNLIDIDFADVVWTSLGGASNNTLAKLIVCYDADTTGGADTAIIPLTAHDFSVTTDGSNLTAQLHASGFYNAAAA